MKILIFSGLVPSKVEKFGGVFIEKRCEIMKSFIDIDLYKIGKKYRKSHRIILEKILKTRKLEDDDKIYKDNIIWNNINIEVNLVNKIIQKHFKKAYYRYCCNVIEKNICMNEYDLIHTHWSYPIGYITMLLAKKYNIPYIITAHGSDIHTIPFKDKKILKYTREVLDNANKVIFVSENLKEYSLKLGYNNKNSKVIYNGVDIDDFNALDKMKIKKKLGLKKHVVGYIGRLEYIKGVDRIPNILKELSYKVEDIEFIIIGDGTLKDKLIKELNLLNIEYKYYKSMNHKKLNNYINACDAIIVPSRNESFSCIALEAQACGTTVVATNVGGIPECVGEFGILVDEGTCFEKRFAEGIEQGFESRINIENMINRAKQFSWLKTVKDEIEIYKEVLDTNKINN